MKNLLKYAIFVFAVIFAANLTQAKSTELENSPEIDTKNGTVKYVSIIDQCNKEAPEGPNGCDQFLHCCQTKCPPGTHIEDKMCLTIPNLALIKTCNCRIDSTTDRAPNSSISNVRSFFVLLFCSFVLWGF